MHGVTSRTSKSRLIFNPLNAELNPICHLLALLGGATIVVISRIRVNRSVYTYTHALRFVHNCNVTTNRNAVTLQVTDTIRSYDLNFHPVSHGVTVSCERYIMGFPVCYGSQKHHESKEGERSGRWWRVTLHVQTCSGRNRIIPMMRRPNTDSAPKMPVTLPRNQLLIHYVVTSPVHTVTIRLRYAVTLQVCTHLNRHCSNY
jgi:hypothetical protein